MKIVLCWVEINAYMASCWREFANRPEMLTYVLAGKPGAVESDNRCSDQVVEGLGITLLDQCDIVKDSSRVRQIVVDQKPDVVFIPGWGCSSFAALAFEKALSNARFIMGFDNPRTDSLRQRLARLKIGRLIERMDMVVVPGERSWQFAVKLLRVPERKVRRGLYGVDYRNFSSALSKRLEIASGWPRRFLFVGRQVPEKGFDLLIQAYRLYRQRSPDPWPLTCCGAGRLSGLINDVRAVEDVGFVQPGQLPDVFARHGVFVLPSRYDPWPLAVVEAAAAGLPVLCSDACGSAVEIVRSYYNGITFATGDARELAKGLVWMQRNHSALPEMGARSQKLAEAYSAQAWADRWQHMVREVVEIRS